MQPTIHELYTAYSIAKEIGTPESLRDLKRIRERKTTWIGNDENACRFMIDKWLRENMEE